jgi:hypothetical protein
MGGLRSGRAGPRGRQARAHRRSSGAPRISGRAGPNISGGPRPRSGAPTPRPPRRRLAACAPGTSRARRAALPQNSHRELPAEGLGAQDDPVRAVQDQVGHVCRLRARRARRVGHRVAHARREHRLAVKVALLGGGGRAGCGGGLGGRGRDGWSCPAGIATASLHQPIERRGFGMRREPALLTTQSRRSRARHPPRAASSARQTSSRGQGSCPSSRATG